MRRRGAWGVVLDGAERSDVGAPQGTTPYSPRSGFSHCQLPELAGPWYSCPAMDLVQQVIGNLEITEDKAEKGIGALLMALRASLDRVAFDGVKAALPHSERLMGRALMSGARTGEMAAVAGPAGLYAALAAAGFQKDDIPRLGRSALEDPRPPGRSRNAGEVCAHAPPVAGG